MTAVLFFSINTFAMDLEPAIFTHLRAMNLEGVKYEMDLDPNWFKLRSVGKSRSNPLRFAIRLKNIQALKQMLNAQVRVTNEDVLLALKLFFQSEISVAYIQDSPSLIGQAQQMILAAKADPNSEDTFKKLAEILHLFARKEHRLQDIVYLFNSKQLSERETHMLLKGFVDSFFLEQEVLSNAQINAIILALLPMKGPHLLLRLLIITYESMLLPCLEQNYCSVSDECKIFPMAEEMAQGIIERSRRIFLTIAPGLLVRAKAVNEEKLLEVVGAELSDDFHQITGAEIKARHDLSRIKGAAMAADRLSTFVSHSILYAEAENEIGRRYRFWGIVYNILLNAGDFMGAFSVASALNSNEIETKVKAKIFQGEDIIEGNFKIFRKKFKSLDGRFRIPVLQILLRDLEPMAEVGVFSTEPTGKLLNKEAIQFYQLFHQTIGQAYRKALECEYPISPRVATILENLPPPGQRFIESELNEAYKVLWPASAHRRRNSISEVILGW